MNAHMNALVRPLHASPALEEAERLWHAAEYSHCLTFLESAPLSAERFLIAARAAYRLRRADVALAQLEQGDAYFLEPEQRAQADALSAVMHQMRSEERQSRVFAERALALCAKHECAGAANMLALRAWMRDDHAECARQIASAERSRDQNARAYALSIRSWIHGSRREFREQAELLQQALRLTLSAPLPDVGLAAVTLQTLTNYCREVYLPEIFSASCEAADRLAWTGDTQLMQYTTLRHIAWTHALAGRYVLGIRQLMRARELAPTDAFRVLSILDASWIAFASEERLNAQAHLANAVEAIERIDWQAASGDELAALLLAAELSAPHDARQARRLLEQYAGLKGSISPHLGVAHHRAFDPMERCTQALLAYAGGEVGPARRMAKEAFREFRSLGYEWRAARCALMLYRWGCGEKWLAAARENAIHYPRSFIGAELSRIASDSTCEPLTKLTPRQREVVHLLIAGQSIDDVAAALKTSRNTVRVHIGRIHRALGVRNRIELIRRTANARR